LLKVVKNERDTKLLKRWKWYSIIGRAGAAEFRRCYMDSNECFHYIYNAVWVWTGRIRFVQFFASFLIKFPVPTTRAKTTCNIFAEATICGMITVMIFGIQKLKKTISEPVNSDTT